MNEIIFEMPAGIAMELASRNTVNANVRANTNFGSEFGDVFIVFEVSPKIYLGARFFCKDFTNYGDDRSDVSPGAPADY